MACLAWLLFLSGEKIKRWDGVFFFLPRDRNGFLNKAQSAKEAPIDGWQRLAIPLLLCSLCF